MYNDNIFQMKGSELKKNVLRSNVLQELITSDVKNATDQESLKAIVHAWYISILNFKLKLNFAIRTMSILPYTFGVEITQSSTYAYFMI